MTDITPPIELVQQWMTEERSQDYFCITEQVAHRAARWGSDQELEACIAWFDKHIPGYELVADRLRAARRPKPPSLKEQSLALINRIQSTREAWLVEELDVVRKALEVLPDD